jgi:O-6-methylguanine DNA methyltransferase
MFERGACSQNSKQQRGVWVIDVCYQKINNVWYGAAVQDNQVCATDFPLEKPELRRLQRKLPHNIPFQVTEEPNQFQTKVLGALEEIFNGKDHESYGFKIALDHLSGYTRKVLNCTSMVPVGYVTTYGALAKAAGGIARSVGRVEASNPVPLLIPCHRVVCSDLSIGGYGYGEQVKMGILQREERGYEESTELEVDEKKLVLFPAKWVK